ncbi:HTH-type quorum sensing-dependent transcriptional regulator VjbR [compost metagenome]
MQHQPKCSVLDIDADYLADLLQRAGDVPEDNEAGGSAAAHLTGRELDVLRLLAAGHRNRAIAELMELSEHTVKTHLRNINAKLGAEGRTAAVAIARAQGLID